MKCFCQTAAALLIFATGLGAPRMVAAPEINEVWSRQNLFVSNFVPFGQPPLGIEERAAMLARLGIKRYVFSFRPQHVPFFDEEAAAAKKYGLELMGWLVISRVEPSLRQQIFDVIERHGIHPQIWIIGGGGKSEPAVDQETRIEREVSHLRPFVLAAKRLHCKVGLYDHGGWFGEPANQLAIIARLEREGLDGVGMVCNFHHSHDKASKFAENWRLTKSKVIAVNLCGMPEGPDTPTMKILPLGRGARGRAMMRVIQESGWQGPVGIIGHRNDQPLENTLVENLSGFDRLAAALSAEKAGATNR